MDTDALPTLVIATHNAHKTAEIRAMLAGLYAVEDLTAHPSVPPADETGTTFEANATIKALEASARLPPGTLVLSDDSGLEVDALDGEPGVYSSRYAGETATDEDNRRKLITAMREIPADGLRTARFRCCMVLATDGTKIAAFDGTVEGTIGTTDRGEGGFGYDPLFFPEGHDATFAELPDTTKNTLSHRARALAGVVAWLQGTAPGNPTGNAGGSLRT